MPSVNGLSFFDKLGGHFKMKFLNKSEYLKYMLTGVAASSATTMGALKSGSPKACIDLPKQNVGYDIYAHAAECVKEIGCFKILTPSLKSCTQFVDFSNQEDL
jgi:hypothetical protein